MKQEIVIMAAVGLATLLIFLAAAARAGQRSRFVPVKVGWGYSLYDLKTRLWLERQIQLRVAVRRTSPEITENNRADVHCTQFDPGGCGTGNLNPNRFLIKDGYCIWQWKEIVNKVDLQGKRYTGIALDEANAEGKKTMELFSYPAISNQEPGQWSEWAKHSKQRTGDFGWWAEVQGEQAAEKEEISHPFELRWRLLLSETPGRLVDDERIDY